MEEHVQSTSEFSKFKHLSSILISTNHHRHNITDSFLPPVKPMAELSPTFGFLIIFKDSFKLIFKNGKFMAPITLLSLLLPSLLLLLLCYVYQTLTNSIYNSSTNLQIIAGFSLFLVLEITSIMAFGRISIISGIATILVSATSYTDANISSQDLYSRIKTTTRRSKLFGYRNSSSKNRGTVFLAMIIWMLVFCMVIFYPNAITIAIAVVVGISVFGFLIYDSVPTVLSSVVSVVEEKFEGSEALKKAEELIQGQRHHGFMINVFINLLGLIILLGFWLVLRGELWSVNVMGFGLFLVNFVCLIKIFGCVAYTVLYFRCKKYHGDDEEVGGVGNFGYSKLPASDLGGGIA
ncbi:hypothetical protein ACS0TY_024424 [Phlomoides rotata]